MSIPMRIREKDGEFQFFEGVRQDMSASFQPEVSKKFTNVHLDFTIDHQDRYSTVVDVLDLSADFQGSHYSIVDEEGEDDGVFNYINNLWTLCTSNSNSFVNTIAALMFEVGEATTEVPEFVQEYMDNIISYLLNGGDIRKVSTIVSFNDCTGLGMDFQQVFPDQGLIPMKVRGVSITNENEESGDFQIISLWEQKLSFDMANQIVNIDYKVSYNVESVSPRLAYLLTCEDVLISPELVDLLWSLPIDLPGAPIFMMVYPLEIDRREHPEYEFTTAMSQERGVDIVFNGLKAEDMENAKIKVVSDVSDLTTVEPFLDEEDSKKVYILDFVTENQGQGYVDYQVTVNGKTYYERCGISIYESLH